MHHLSRIMQNLHKTCDRFEIVGTLRPTYTKSCSERPVLCFTRCWWLYSTKFRILRSDYWRCRQFATTTVLLGLTAYRVHYTKRLDHPDVLTTRTHFYGEFSDFLKTSNLCLIISSLDPRIVALMVASIVGLIFTLAMYFLASFFCIHSLTLIYSGSERF